jgi:hypothetical protein
LACVIPLGSAPGHQPLLAYSNKETSRREDATLRSAINFGKPITHLKDL